MTVLNETKVSGFTIVRNGRILDYPFRESIQSILPLCDELIISVGDSEDDTLETCQALVREYPKIRIIETRWNSKGQRHGFQLSEKTNECLNECRNPWAFYIQADEVVHEADHENIRQALKWADTRPEIDGLAFDYHHFYGDYRHTIQGRSWYRREVRLIRTGERETNQRARSFRDAQGFRIGDGPLTAALAGARIFHYGYIRSPESLRTKAEHMTKWWGASPGNDYRLRRHIGLRRFQETHPAVMNARIDVYPNSFDPKQHPVVWDRRELKDFLTWIWESIIPLRIGEFKNYRLIATRHAST